MSLLKWQELAKSKSKLGDKIKYAHDMITKHNISEQPSQESFAKLFNPVTSKLDEVIDSNLALPRSPGKRRPMKKWDVPDYGIPVADEVEDMGLGDLFDEQPILPDSEKQIVQKPPTYEQSLDDLIDGKEIYVDPQYLPQEPQELPPNYEEEEEEVDYTLDDDDISNEILNDIGITNYENVEKILNQQAMTPGKTKAYLKKIVADAILKRSQLSGYKSHITKQFNKGVITEAERQINNKRIDNARHTLNEYIKHYKTKMNEFMGSGIRKRDRRIKQGGNIIFFNDTMQLVKKLELIIYSIQSGNSSIQMRNTGVSILDTLLKMATINRPQYNKLFNQYFKV